MVKGASADTFFPTWAADGNLYTGFTDGHVVDDETQKSATAKSEGSAPLYTVTHGAASRGRYKVILTPPCILH